MRSGIYIVFEGMVGCGKTTQSKLLERKLIEKFKGREIVRTWEPGGGSEIAGEIRRVFQGMRFTEKMEPVCEQYLVAAARAQTLRTIVRPTLARGGIVLSDYSFLASVAYQGFGRGLGFEKVMQVNEVAVEGLWPDLGIVLDIPVKVALKRTFDEKGDKFESLGEDFFVKVQKGYRFLAEKYPDRVKMVDATGDSLEVAGRVWSVVTAVLG